jgi:hypothetical protein
MDTRAVVMEGVARKMKGLPRSSYSDGSFNDLEKGLSELASGGASRSERANYIKRVFLERDRAILKGAKGGLDPTSVADTYLLPRMDLSRFVVENWIRHIFLVDLKPRLSQSIFMFGLGRLFSAYNDLGVQDSTDVDLNIIIQRGVPIADIAALKAQTERLRSEILEHFGIVVELHPDFSVLGEQAVLARLEHPDERLRFAHGLFYKSNERSIHILHDHPEIRERVFSRARGLPDACLFEHFLGLTGGAKSSFARIRSGEPLEIGQESLVGVERVRTVIGSSTFDLYCRRLFPQNLLVSPPEWHFSMKYYVNRVYDYVCAMRNLGYPLERIGFGAAGGDGGGDPDFRYLRNAHKLMLHLQELTRGTIGAYTENVDSSYISRSRFLRFIEIGGDGFHADFNAMVVKGELIPPSRAKRYQALEAKIKAKARDRFMEGPLAELKSFPPGFRYESTSKDKDRYRVCVPYSWADPGYYAFSAIAERLAAIVEEKLLPALPALGLPEKIVALYREKGLWDRKGRSGEAPAFIGQ